MKHTVALTVTSLLSILFVTFHFTSDTLHAHVGTLEAGGVSLLVVPILVVWMYGTLVLAERRSGYVIMLLGALIALFLPVIHVMGAGRRFSRRDRQVERSVLVRLDASRPRRDGDVFRHSLGAWIMEPADRGSQGGLELGEPKIPRIYTTYEFFRGARRHQT